MSRRRTIDLIEAYATKAHGEQRRKYTPELYIVHPIRVMKICAEYSDKTTILYAALLHDVLEDTDIDEQQMFSFLKTVMEPNEASETLLLVVDLTDVYTNEKYPQFNRRKRKDLERERIAHTNADSQTIKYADIIDNCNEIVKHDRDFARVFLNECRATLKIMGKGDERLYRRAVETVEKNLLELNKN